MLEHGLVDRIVPRSGLRAAIGGFLRYLMPPLPPPVEKPPVAEPAVSEPAIVEPAVAEPATA
jgi:hypothetical protein